MLTDPGARFTQGVVAIGLLAGFVFGVEWAIPMAALLMGLDALMGSGRGPLGMALDTFLASRSSSNHPKELGLDRSDSRPARFHALGVATALLIATIAWRAGLTPVAWLIAILMAGVCALASASRICLGCEAYQRLSRR